ncbi:MAG: hypothetical protein MUE72_13855 [Chitinophagaceae bacterium]|jgi:hypothetical protein|nr:hypothetical protein [Chitinophagaceae bacterium]
MHHYNVFVHSISDEALICRFIKIWVSILIRKKDAKEKEQGEKEQVVYGKARESRRKEKAINENNQESQEEKQEYKVLTIQMLKHLFIRCYIMQLQMREEIKMLQQFDGIRFVG